MLMHEPLLVFNGVGERPVNGCWAAPSQGGLRRVEDGLRASAVVSFADATRNIAVLGGSGSGKTVGIARPALERLIEAGCGGLVLDVKGDYQAFAKRHPERVCLIGPVEGAQPVNLTRGMGLQAMEAFLNMVRLPPMRDQPYWGAMGVADALFLYRLLQLMDGEASILTVGRILASPEASMGGIDDWIGTHDQLPQDFADALEVARANAFGVLSKGGSRLMSAAKVLASDGELDRQYTWQVNPLLDGLRPFLSDQRLAEAFFASGAPDLEELVYRQRKVLILALPYTEFAVPAYTVSRLLRSRFMHTVLTYPHHRAEGYGRERFTFLLADEYQQYVRLEDDATRTGMLDDNTWFDRSREFGHINLVSTHGVSSLRARANGLQGSAGVNSLLQNVGTLVVLGSHDPDVHALIGDFASGADADFLSHHLRADCSVGEGVLLSRRLERHAGALAARICTGSVAGFPYMGKFLSEPLEWQPTPVRSASPKLVANKYALAGLAGMWNRMAQHSLAAMIERTREALAEGEPEVWMDRYLWPGDMSHHAVLVIRRGSPRPQLLVRFELDHRRLVFTRRLDELDPLGVHLLKRSTNDGCTVPLGAAGEGHIRISVEDSRWLSAAIVSWRKIAAEALRPHAGARSTSAGAGSKRKRVRVARVREGDDGFTAKLEEQARA